MTTPTEPKEVWCPCCAKDITGYFWNIVGPLLREQEARVRREELEWVLYECYLVDGDKEELKDRLKALTRNQDKQDK